MLHRTLPLAKKIGEQGDMLRSCPCRAGPPDVEEISFAGTPAVALHVVTEEKLGNFRLDPAAGEVLGDASNSISWAATTDAFRFSRAKPGGDRAKMAAGADQHRGFDVAVDEPSPGRSFERSNRLAQPAASAGTIEQIMIELAAANAETHRLAVMRFDFAAADQAGAETGERLKHPLAAGGVIDLSTPAFDTTCGVIHPAQSCRAETLFIEHQHIDAVAHGASPRKTNPRDRRRRSGRRSVP